MIRRKSVYTSRGRMGRTQSAVFKDRPQTHRSNTRRTLPLKATSVEPIKAPTVESPSYRVNSDILKEYENKLSSRVVKKERIAKENTQRKENIGGSHHFRSHLFCPQRNFSSYIGKRTESLRQFVARSKKIQPVLPKRAKNIATNMKLTDIVIAEPLRNSNIQINPVFLYTRILSLN